MSRAWQIGIVGAGTKGRGTAPVTIFVSVLAMAYAIGLDPFAPHTAAAAPNKESASASAGDAASAQRDVESGIKSLQDGKLDAAVQQLSSALASGKLPSTQMARALYYRGITYRRQNKPAQAIADLTSALWLKNGLDSRQKADAQQNRAEAYREAGLSDQADADDKKVASGGASQSSWTSFTSDEPAPAQSSSGGIGGFFGNLFGSSSSESATEQSESRPREKAAPPPAAVAWSDATEVRKVEKTAATAPAVTGSTPPVRASGKTSAGGIRLQVAAVRSLSEAQSVAARVKHMGIKDEAEIDKYSVGNMGTFYRVLIGPFADSGEPQRLCAKLRNGGLDCLVTAQ
jgi:SPOR domain